MKLHYYQDPGHGWVKISEVQLQKYAPEIINRISGYSYHVAGVAVYLEEDRDLALFVSALRDRGMTFEFIPKYTNQRSKIRNYSSFNALAIGLGIGSTFYLNQYGTYTIEDTKGLYWVVRNEHNQRSRVKKDWIASEIER